MSSGQARRLATAESEVTKLRAEVRELLKRIEDIEYRLDRRF
jgi:hypothetical protein